MSTGAPQEMKLPPVRQPYSLEQASSHTNRNIICKTPESVRGRKCGDGRDGQELLEAIFGSDLGYAFAAQAALHDLNAIPQGQEKQSLKRTLGLVAGDGKVWVHTDDHHGNETKLYGGCGANRVARENKEKFGLTDADFEALDETMQEYDNEGRVERAVYKGPHNEGAVVLVRGKDFGIKANDEKNNSSVFVATVDLIEDRLHDLAKQLAPEYHLNEQELYERMHARWAGQTEEIRLALAKLPDGTMLPVYQAQFDPQGKATLQQA